MGYRFNCHIYPKKNQLKYIEIIYHKNIEKRESIFVNQNRFTNGKRNIIIKFVVPCYYLLSYNIEK